LVSEPVSNDEEAEKRKPPRKVAVLGVFRDLYRRIAGAETQKKKAETDHQRNERRMAQWTARVGYFTGFLVLFSAIGNWIIYGQLQEMKATSKQTDDLVISAQKSAKAAQDALELAKDTARRQLRAYVFADSFVMAETPDGKKIIVKAKFKNTGQTPALRATANGLLILEKDGVILRNSPVISEKDYGTYGRDSDFGVGAAFNITEDFVSDLKGGLLTIRFKGNVSYADIFDETHFLPFDFHIRPLAGGATFIMTPDANAEENKEEKKMPEIAH
jgi:hypothetical protein